MPPKTRDTLPHECSIEIVGAPEKRFIARVLVNLPSANYVTSDAT